MASIETKLFAYFKAVSTDSVKRVRTSSFITNLSTTISILCFFFLSISIVSVNSYKVPSILARTKPSFWKSSNSFTY